MVEEEYPTIDEQQQEEELEDNIERQAEISQEVYSDTAPSYREKDDLYSLFWRVVRTQESSKVGNLDPKLELGLLNMTVRDMQRIAWLARTLNHPGFAIYFEKLAEIVLATSASKKGWLPELFVSQRKFTTKEKAVSQPVGIQPQQRKGFFARWKRTE